MKSLLEKIKGTDLKKKPILVIGDIMLDRYFFGSVRRISPEAPVPVLELDDSSPTLVKLGGAGNTATNLTRLGLPTSIVSFIGNDDEGKLVKNVLDSEFITGCVLSPRDFKTVRKDRYYADTQQILRVDRETLPPYNRTISDAIIDEIDRALLNCSAILISDYGKGVLSDKRILTETFRSAKELDIPIIAAAQLNRLSEARSEKKPQVSDLRESGEIEQSADTVILIHQTNEGRQLIIGKQRMGVSDRTIDVYFDEQLIRFKDAITTIVGGR